MFMSVGLGSTGVYRVAFSGVVNKWKKMGTLYDTSGVLMGGFIFVLVLFRLPCLPPE